MSETNGVSLDRSELARWYARRHFEFDPGVVEIYHLPANAPEDEIRLLEVNREIPELTGPPEPVDFGVNVGGGEASTLYVLDVTPGQWQAIRAGSLPLPAGWALDGRDLLASR